MTKAHWKITLKNGTVFDDERVSLIEDHGHCLVGVGLETKTFEGEEETGHFWNRKVVKVTRKIEERTQLLIVPLREVRYCESVDNSQEET